MSEEKTNQATELPVVSKLSPYQYQVAELEAIVADYKNLVVTEENLKDCQEAKKKLFRIRTKELKPIYVANTETIKEILEGQKTKWNQFMSIIEPVEKQIGAGIEIVEAEVERKKKEKAALELKRLECHRAKIRELNQQMMKVNSINKPEELALISTDWFKEYKAEEFETEISNLVMTLNSQISARLELLNLRVKEEAARKLKEAEEKQQQADLAIKNAAQNKINELSAMIAKSSQCESISEIDKYIHLCESDGTEYGENAPQALAILGALKVIAEARKVVLIESIPEKEVAAPNLDGPGEEEKKLFAPLRKYPLTENDAIKTPDVSAPAEAIGSATHEPQFDYFEEKGLDPADALEQVKELLDDNLNHLDIGIYTIALSKNIPEKEAQSIIRYVTHILTK